MSAPGSPNISIAANIVTLPPGTISTDSADTSDAHAVVRGRWPPHHVTPVSPYGGCIPVLSVSQGLDTCIHDVRGCGEVRLADAEIDDVHAPSGKLLRTCEHTERVLLADTAEAGNQSGSVGRTRPSSGY